MNVDEFLEFLFPGVNGGDPTEAVCIAELASGDDGREDYWIHTRWVPGTLPDPLRKHYFCISTVNSGPRDQRLRRRLSDLRRTFVIGLDDIGTAANSKVRPDIVPAAPTIRMETSPGNEQWLYKLEYPVAPADAGALIKGLATAGYTDKGAVGANRVLRLPGSLNTKYDAPFWSRVVS